MTSTAILWFRRDLRLADNPALVDAVDHADEVVGVFCVDPVLWQAAGDNRRALLVDHLTALDRSMDGHLVVLAGDPVAIHLEADHAHPLADRYPADAQEKEHRRRVGGCP